MPAETPPRTPLAVRGRTTLRYALSAGLTIFFLWVAFGGTDVDQLILAIRGANYWWIGAMVACLLLSHLVRAWRWRYLLEPIKRGIRIRNLFSGVMVGYLFNNLLPRAGELTRPYVIGTLEKISRSSAFGTIVVERIIDTFSFLLLVALLPFVYSGPLIESFPWLHRAGLMITAATAGVLLLTVILMVRRDWTNRLLGIFGVVLPARFARRMEGFVHAFLDGFLFLTRPANFLLIVAQSAMIWTLYIVMMYVAFFAFDLGGLGIAAAVVVQTISSIGVAVPTPGGTGSYHAFASQSLVKLFGVDPAAALSYATVTHAAGFISVSVWGLYFFFRDHVRTSDALKSQTTEPV
ncbi:MAG: lysylphosphatidylglycerol synthase transmembrane domain-containing protein [Bacteroidota bacterium]